MGLPDQVFCFLGAKVNRAVNMMKESFSQLLWKNESSIVGHLPIL